MMIRDRNRKGESMTHIIYYVAASVDGYIATADGGVEWLSAFDAAGEDYGYHDFYASVDGIVMGSRTYQQVLDFGDWPYPGKPTWVLSSRNVRTTREEVTVTSQSPLKLALEMDIRKIDRLWLVGGANLAASFRANGLISEYIVSIMPVVLGAGIPLLKAGGRDDALELSQVKRYSTGVVQLHYVPAAEPET
jgi:dihydrofolate reductase